MIDVAEELHVDGETLIREYLATGDEETREKAIRAFLPLVKYIVGRMNIPQSIALGKEDIYQFGILGLLEALGRFRPELGVKFRTFAYKRIQGQIVDAIRQLGLIGREQIKKLKQVETAINRLVSILGREPTPAEVCKELDVTEKEYSSILEVSQLNYTLSLDEKVFDNGEDSLYRIETITDETQESPDEAMSNESLKSELKIIVQELPERERLILALYYYEELTLSDIGRVLGLSESRVCQILNQTLLNIRGRLEL